MWTLIPKPTDVAGWLELCCIGYIAYLVVWTFWKRRRPKHTEWWMKKLDQWAKRKDKMKGWARTNEMPIALAFSACVLTSLGWMTYITRYPVPIEHHVAVYGRFDNGDWDMSSDEEGRFAYRPCDDFDVAPMLIQSVGYIADHARWEQRPDCRSIRATGLGFFWRDEQGKYRRIDNATRAAR